MDYKRIYAAFIADRRTKELTLIGYRERHHILPRCMGGTDDDSNLIYLTAEDHFFAHLLLAKAYGGEMWYALTAMTVEYGRRKECGEYLRRARKASALARERAARVHSARMKGVFSGEKHPMYGKPCPELAKQRTRERMAAGLYPMASTETRRKVSKALKGRVLTPEWRDKISRSRIGWRDSEETRLKKSRSHLGKKLSQESIEKLRVAMTGIKRSPETIERMPASKYR